MTVSADIQGSADLWLMEDTHLHRAILGTSFTSVFSVVEEMVTAMLAFLGSGGSRPPGTGTVLLPILALA